AWDVPFNEGVMTAFEVVAEPGSIVNPRPPAPISNGHLTTGARVSRLIVKLFNQVCRASDDPVLQGRTQGVWADSWTGGISAGTRDDGGYFVLFNMDGGGMGAGAQPEADGLDCAGMMTQMNNMLPDVEMNEMLYPVLYLWKRLSPASAGHGAHRGGLGQEFAWTLHGASQVTQTVFAPSAQVPADGYGGGLPGGGSGHLLCRDTDVWQLMSGGAVPTDETLSSTGRRLLDINQYDLTVRHGDVFVQWIAGGGGYGDPFLRDPALVAQDVNDGYVSAAVAESVYGVVFDGDRADAAATAARRDALRTERLAGTPPAKPILDSAIGSAGASVPRLGADGHWYCPASGALISTADDWHDDVAIRTRPAAERLAELGVRIRPRSGEPAVLLDEFISPSCGTLLETRIRVATP
ncbi:hydantoinase B/oxoprolinase family protein, partial [Acrocarpospora sp. B8E8]|uniref:hydantoinase B/oxoprolinase family protein n=1 Tax=Acrocarpospora sp. B8E8 TaxID=3153572 RepID=UPI00325C47DB